MPRTGPQALAVATLAMAAAAAAGAGVLIALHYGAITPTKGVAIHKKPGYVEALVQYSVCVGWINSYCWIPDCAYC